jgi:NADPH2:quinone reductase
MCAQTTLERDRIMAKTILVSDLGGPEVMKLVDMDPGKPGPGEVRLRQTAIGINFADVHYRRGTAPAHSMKTLPIPFTPGLEGVGFVEAVGAGVSNVEPGDRVAYASASLTIGAYTEVRLFPADRVFPLPETIRDIDAAALLYRAITVQGMIFQCYPVRAGETVLVHAAAGGVGQILSRWAKHLGATIIGTVSKDDKAERARAVGCDHVIVNSREDFVARTLEITQGRGVDVVYDGVGIDVFLRSFGAIRKYGTMVSFGQASGLVEPLDPIQLQHNGIYLTKFSGGTYNADVDEYQQRARDVVAAIEKGVFELGNYRLYEMKDAVAAHIDLEGRKTTGSLVMVP